MIIDTIRATVKAYPAVLPYLSNKTRYLIACVPDETKDAGDMEKRVANLVNALYRDTIDIGSFIDSMAALISRQITLAYNAAWVDDGNELPIPAYLVSGRDNMILSQFMFVDGYMQDIINARLLGNSVNPLLSRAALWANRYNEAYNNAQAAIALQMGGKLKWVEGDTNKKCPVCLKLDGIVAYASIWNELQVQPQNAPNPALSMHSEGCQGWRCECSLVPTEERQTRNARIMIQRALLGG